MTQGQHHLIFIETCAIDSEIAFHSHRISPHWFVSPWNSGFDSRFTHPLVMVWVTACLLAKKSFFHSDYTLK